MTNAKGGRLQWLGRHTLIGASIIVLSLLLPGFSLGETFWEDNFESHLVPNWDVGIDCGDPAPEDGCNPAISTEQAHSGARSLRADYTANCTVDGCGTFYDRLHTSTDEIWTRFYYRTANFTYDSVTTKWFYNADFHLPGYPNGVWGTKWGGRQVHFEGQNVAEVCPDGSGDGFNPCEYPANMASIQLNDDTWYCIETHWKLNTPSIADGSLEAFVDGTQVIGYYGRLFRGSAPDGPNGNSSLTTFRFVRIYAQFGRGIIYYDDFAAGNTRIGCQGTSSPPTPTAQDAAPVENGIRVQTANGAHSVRSGPDSSLPAIGSIPDGSLGTAISGPTPNVVNGELMYDVKWDDQSLVTGWIKQSNLTLLGGGSVPGNATRLTSSQPTLTVQTVNGDHNVRSGPDSSLPAIGSIPDGSLGTVISGPTPNVVNGELMYDVKWNDQSLVTGWIKQSNLTGP